MENRGQQFGRGMWGEGSQRPSSFERKYPVPTKSSKSIGLKKPEIKKTKEIINPWGTYSKVLKKPALEKIKADDFFRATNIPEGDRKKILEETLGKTDYIHKGVLDKAIMKAKAKLSGPTTKIQTEGTKELKCLLHVKKSIEQK